MKKTISIHLTGFVFNIEEEAYILLQEYLDKIRQNLSYEEGCDEIMEDIEMRIAELFQERMGLIKEVIVQKDILDIMGILGDPTDFASDEEVPFQETQTAPEDDKVKRLFRDKDGGTIGGVCSGLGHYFYVDALVFRVIFVALFLLLGSGILLYLVLMIFIPEAKTTADKLKMRGEPINLDSIKKHVNQFAESLSDRANSNKIRNNVRSAVEQGVDYGRTALNIISKIIGVAFSLAGFILFIFLLNLLFRDTGLIPFIGENNIPDIYTAIEISFPGKNWTFLIFLCIILVSLIPLISLIITGIRLITKNKTRTKEISWFLSITWTLAAVTLFIYSMGIVNDMKDDNTIKETIILEEPGCQELIIDVIDDNVFSNHFNPNRGLTTPELIKSDEESIYIGLTKLSIISIADTGNFELILYKYSRGKNEQEAIERSEQIVYELETEGNHIFLPAYYSFPVQDKIRGQFLHFTLMVPMGKKVKFGPQSDRLKLDKRKYKPLLSVAPLDTMIYTINQLGDTNLISEIRID